MNNPWSEMSDSPPYILKSDSREIEVFNKKYQTTDYAIHSELIPEPYIGNLNSEIVLLNLNPGFSNENSKEHKTPYFKSILLDNLTNKNISFPFYYLNPKLSHVRGANWWTKKLKSLITIYGLENVANGLLCIEYFPYHSKKYRNVGKILESQEYSFYLVRQTIQAQKLIIIMRSRKIWEEAVPILTKYKKAFALNNPQNVYVTKNNCPNGFPFIENIFAKR
jgi:hypothetical protein